MQNHYQESRQPEPSLSHRHHLPPSLSLSLSLLLDTHLLLQDQRHHQQQLFRWGKWEFSRATNPRTQRENCGCRKLGRSRHLSPTLKLSRQTAQSPAGLPPLALAAKSNRGSFFYTLIAREEEIYLKIAGDSGAAADREGDLELLIPPIFKNCTRILDREEQIAARDLYWEAVCVGEMGLERAEEKPVESIAKNPYVGKGYVVRGKYWERRVHGGGGSRVEVDTGVGPEHVG